MSLLIDGFTAGLALAVWALGALLAIALVSGCVIGGWLLIENAYDTIVDRLRTSRPVWWLRARRSIRRQRRPDAPPGTWRARGS